MQELLDQKKSLQAEIIRMRRTDPLRANKLQSLKEIIRQIDYLHRPKKVDKDFK